MMTGRSPISCATAVTCIELRNSSLTVRVRIQELLRNKPMPSLIVDQHGGCVGDRLMLAYRWTADRTWFPWACRLSFRRKHRCSSASAFLRRYSVSVASSGSTNTAPLVPSITAA